MPAPRPQILVIRRRYLGDIVLLGPVFRNLRWHWPQARLCALVESPYAGVLALNPDVDDTLVLPQSVGQWLRFLARLRQAGFTHVFNFDNTERTALLTRLTGAPFRLVLHHGGLPVKLRSCYTHVAHHPPAEHENRPFTEYYLHALPAAGVPIVTREVRLIPRGEDLAFVRGLLGSRLTGPGGASAAQDARPRTLLVHPGSRSPFRLWPAERFARVIDRLAAELGVRTCLVAGPGEHAILQEIRRHLQTDPVIFDAPLSVGQLAALITQFPVLLCHDSGPMHLAAAVGTRVVALLGSQNPVLFAPPGPGHTVLQPPLPCQHCVAPGECVPGDSYRNFCIRNLAEDAVVAALRAHLAPAASPL